MHEITYEPKLLEILPRKFAFTTNTGDLAAALQPWVQRNSKFTQEAVLKLVGLRFDDKTDARFMVETWQRVKKALQLLGLRHAEFQPHADRPRIYQCPSYHAKVLADVPLRIGLYGYTERPEVPDPPADQVELCRQWIKKHCRARATMHGSNTISKTCFKVEAWSRTLPGIKNRLQYNHVDKNFFRAPFYTIRPGALMQAAILEGYDLKRTGNSSDAKHNMSVRNSDKPWRGRTPGVCKPEEPDQETDVTLTLIRVDVDQKRATKAKEKLQKFLAMKKQIFDVSPVRELEPFFTIQEAGKVMRLKVKEKRPSRTVVKLLREAGCVVTTLRRKAKVNPDRQWLKLRAESYRAWVRFADMPQTWQFANWKLREQLAKESTQGAPASTEDDDETPEGAVWDPEEQGGVDASDDSETPDNAVWDPEKE